ncbi:TRAF3-interacting protein 1-like [Diadema antillarum]|uniref:TRAF3-interacting protein 1-like n=1 Tax=Diadema antillarum TaxID=105358 RepID=UPI003A89D75E
MGEEYIKKTQDSLGKIIKKPPMTEKLLKKPPFRFLHDIFTEVIRTTGFMKGLFTEAEMDSQNVKDKDAKIAFLQKAIDVVAMVTGKSLSVRPSKIVAGHEPEKTNEFLQAIGVALSKKLDSADSVKKVLNGEKGGSSGKPPRPKKDEEKKSRETSGDKRNRDNKEKKSSSDNRDRSGSRDRAKDDKKNREHSKDRDQREKSGKDRDRSKDREKERSRDKEEKSRSKEKERSRDKERSRGRDGEKEKEDSREKEKEKEREERDRERRERRRRKDEEALKAQSQNDDDESDDTEDLRPTAPESEDGGGGNRIPRPTSAKGSRRRPMKDSDDSDAEGEPDVGRQESAKQRPRHQKEDNEGGLTADDALPPQVTASRRMARPSSARPAPPRLRKQDSTEDSSRVGSGKQVTSVIVDNPHNTDDDDDDTFLVEDSQPVIDDEPRPMASESIEDDGEHGGLVKKILETKKELEGSQTKQDEKLVVLDPARRKERELVQREVERLRGAIQTLTRSANPLGKIMDYLQEDVDSMQKELELWQRENKEHGLAIKREQGITDSELEPLQAQLAELDQAIADQVDTIAAVKSNILRNEEKIGKMVNSIAFTR